MKLISQILKLQVLYCVILALTFEDKSDASSLNDNDALQLNSEPDSRVWNHEKTRPTIHSQTHNSIQKKGISQKKNRQIGLPVVSEESLDSQDAKFLTKDKKLADKLKKVHRHHKNKTHSDKTNKKRHKKEKLSKEKLSKDKLKKNGKSKKLKKESKLGAKHLLEGSKSKSKSLIKKKPIQTKKGNGGTKQLVTNSKISKVLKGQKLKHLLTIDHDTISCPKGQRKIAGQCRCSLLSQWDSEQQKCECIYGTYMDYHGNCRNYF